MSTKKIKIPSLRAKRSNPRSGLLRFARNDVFKSFTKKGLQKFSKIDIIIVMEYSVCVKTVEERNLLHIVRARELKKPLYANLAVVKTVEGEDAAYQLCADLVEEFCKNFWDAGQKPNFDAFKGWLEERTKDEQKA